MEQLIIRLAIKNMHNAGMIPCIKFVRALTYKGLKESKDLVEEIMTESNLTFPKNDWQLQNEVSFLQQENAQLKDTINSLKDQLRNIIKG